MTDTEKYAEILKALGEIIRNKNTEIYLLKYDVETLKKKLAEAEKQIAAAQIERNEEVTK